MRVETEIVGRHLAGVKSLKERFNLGVYPPDSSGIGTDHFAQRDLSQSKKSSHTFQSDLAHLSACCTAADVAAQRAWEYGVSWTETPTSSLDTSSSRKENAWRPGGRNEANFSRIFWPPKGMHVASE